jgi:hypothetical protein
MSNKWALTGYICLLYNILAKYNVLMHISQAPFTVIDLEENTYREHV